LTYKNVRGLAVDAKGDVWVAVSTYGQTSYNRVDEYSSEGKFMQTLGWGVKDGEAKFETCSAECKNGIAGSGEGEFNQPAYVAIDAAGNLWVTDSGNNRVQEFSPTDEYMTQFGSTGFGTGQFSSPQGIAISDGLAYVVDNGNDRAEKWAILE
jgi:DNA-binding beta-propeller fold protein YncE